MADSDIAVTSSSQPEWQPKVGGAALLQCLKAKPELNGQSVTIEALEGGRWKCKVAPFGDMIKVRAENLGPPEVVEDTSGEWLQRNVIAVVRGGREDLEGQAVRVLAGDHKSRRCEVVVRSTNEKVVVDAAHLRPSAWLASEEEKKRDAEDDKKKQSAENPAPRDDWNGFRPAYAGGAGGASYRPGVSVVLEGLKAMPELNGRRGKLIAVDGTSMRWRVEVEDAGVKALKAVNLIVQGEDGSPESKRQRIE